MIATMDHCNGHQYVHMMIRPEEQRQPCQWRGSRAARCQELPHGPVHGVAPRLAIIMIMMVFFHDDHDYDDHDHHDGHDFDGYDDHDDQV